MGRSVGEEGACGVYRWERGATTQTQDGESAVPARRKVQRVREIQVESDEAPLLRTANLGEGDVGARIQALLDHCRDIKARAF